MSDTLQHLFAKINDIHIHYVRKGNGDKAIIFLHGWPEFWYSWRFQLEALSDTYTVIAPDLRGFADSDKPVGIENYHAHVVAADIAALIHHCGFKKAYIVGHDWGGAIAWTFASLYPDMTDKLAILNCPHPVLFTKALSTNIKQLGRSWYMFFFQLPVVPEFLIGNSLKIFFTTFIKGWMYNPENMLDTDIDKYVQAYKQSGALTSSINYYRASMHSLLSFKKKKYDKKIYKHTITCASDMGKK